MRQAHLVNFEGNPEGRSSDLSGTGYSGDGHSGVGAFPFAGRKPLLPFSDIDLEDLTLVNLERAYAPQVIHLEPLIYPKGWSESLLLAEFDKKISFRPSLLYRDEVMAYSFNYIVEDELHILNLAVRPEVQGRGFGFFLLQELLTEVQSRGVKYCFLEVRKSNLRAQELYFKAGFVANGIRREYYSDNREDALMMEYYL